MRALTSIDRKNKRQINIMGLRLPKNVAFVWGVSMYLSLATLVFAGVTADQQWFCHHEVPHICDQYMVNGDRGFAAMIAVFPPLWIAAVFITGGFAYGFTFEAVPDVYAQENYP